MDISPLQGMILLILFTVIDFVMYAYASASQNLNENEIKEAADNGNVKAKKIHRIMDKPFKIINIVQIITSVSAFVSGFLVLKAFTGGLDVLLANYDNDFRVFMKVLCYIGISVVIICFIQSVGVFLPKHLGMRKPEEWAYRFVGIVNFLLVVFGPAQAVVTAVSHIILRIFGIDPSEETENVTEEEIISIVNEGHEQGVLEEREAEMISNIIEMDEKIASDVMVHRTSVVAIDGEMTVDEVIDFVFSEGNSRFPVYEGDIDNIIGIVHIRDIFRCEMNKENSSRRIKDFKDILREPIFIPETRSIDSVFVEMQKEKNHFQIVVDEYGQTAGIITMEDILEEIVGNIFDEYDEEEHNIVKEADNVYLVKGMTPLEELEDTFGMKFEDDDYDTLNGYLICKLDRIPVEGEKIQLSINGYKYEVVAIENKMISQVRMTVPEKAEEENIEE